MKIYYKNTGKQLLQVLDFSDLKFEVRLRVYFMNYLIAPAIISFS